MSRRSAQGGQPTRATTAIVGAGRLARALLPLLLAAGYPVQAIAARRPAAARRAVRRVASGVRVTSHSGRAVAGAGLVLVAVPDRAIADVATQLAAEGDWNGRVALHHAGALGPDVLAPLARAGAAVGVLHPLQVLGDPAIAALTLPGSRARIEGVPAAVKAARRLARDLGLVTLRLPIAPTAVQRQAYHAAASIVSNDLVGLLRLGTLLLQRAGLGSTETMDALVPLARGTLAQLEGGGFASSLTGPAVRGDLETLRGHLKQLARISKDAAAVHRLLSIELVELARAMGLDVPASQGRSIREL